MTVKDKLALWEQYFLNEDKKKKKKPYDSVTYTTGDIDYNIKQFNKHMGTDFNNPSTEEAKARKAAEEANKAVGTVTADTPDGGIGTTTSTGTSAGSGSDSGSGDGGSSGAAVGESWILTEDQMYAAKLDKMVDLPEEIHIIDKNYIEEELEKLAPEEEFEVGYITPVYFYKELTDKFTLLKCTQLAGYTGVDYIEARADDTKNQAARIQLSKYAIALGNAQGVHLDRQPLARQAGDFSANYASTNKTVLQNNGNTLLFYPKIRTRPKVTYFLDLHDGRGYMVVSRDVLEETILAYVRGFIDELRTGRRKDGKPSKMRWGSEELADKIKKELASDARTIDAVVLDSEDKLETRSRISGQQGSTIAKPQVRALYTNQIYYIKTPYAKIGLPILTENAKRKAAAQLDKDFGWYIKNWD